jgi:hypothetical protein
VPGAVGRALWPPAFARTRVTEQARDMRDRLLDPEREEVAPRPRVVEPAPPLARIMALQRSAGNQAVGRMLSRFSEEEEQGFKKTHKKKMQEAAELFRTNFLFGPYEQWPFGRNLDHYMREAANPDDLVTRITADIEKAKEWAKTKDQKPPPPEKKQPAAATQPEPKKEPKEKKEKQAPMSLEDFNASLPDVNKWDQALPGAMTTAEANPVMPGTNGPPLTYQFDRETFTSPITNWDLKDHGGKNATSLTIDHVRQIVTWLTGTYKRKGAVWVRRGPGSGGWSDTHQLKIIHKVIKAPGSEKRVTYHLTLKPGVYNDLTDVPFAGADWAGES